MSLASKIGWTVVASALLTTGMLVEGFPGNAAGAESNKEGVSAFVIKNEITKMQEILLIIRTLPRQGRWRLRSPDPSQYPRLSEG